MGEIYLLSVLSIHPGGIGLSCLFVQHTHKQYMCDDSDYVVNGMMMLRYY